MNHSLSKCPYCGKCEVLYDVAAEKVLVTPCEHLMYVQGTFSQFELQSDGTDRVQYRNRLDWKHPLVESVDPKGMLSDTLCDLVHGYVADSMGSVQLVDFSVESHRQMTEDEGRYMRSVTAEAGHKAPDRERSPDAYMVRDYDIDGGVIWARDATELVTWFPDHPGGASAAYR